MLIKLPGRSRRKRIWRNERPLAPSNSAIIVFAGGNSLTISQSTALLVYDLGRLESPFDHTQRAINCIVPRLAHVVFAGLQPFSGFLVNIFVSAGLNIPPHASQSHANSHLDSGANGIIGHLSNQRTLLVERFPDAIVFLINLAAASEPAQASQAKFLEQSTANHRPACRLITLVSESFGPILLADAIDMRHTQTILMR